MPRNQRHDDVLEVTIRRKAVAQPPAELRMRITLHLAASLLARLDRARAKYVEVEGEPLTRSNLIEAIVSDYLTKEGY